MLVFEAVNQDSAWSEGEIGLISTMSIALEGADAVGTDGGCAGGEDRESAGTGQSATGMQAMAQSMSRSVCCVDAGVRSRIGR